jgi:hypothetical protein
VRVEDRLDRLGGGLDRQIEIGAGVTVGDGIDVDRVDLLAGPAQCLERETAPGTHRGSVERGGQQVLLRDTGDGELLQVSVVVSLVTAVGGPDRGARGPW